ncbi:hypothetical protein KDH_06730 [Dictyobacter sp. S3.2.2.5]|uniref:Restriction endonuclease domain-containing protein n=1 Tax=Dictyobacter halimunensis TaxID=3026934 RepID=A0ABQ6FI71_9CHLR|nr:hypothetical protein KDH_06730 [Dictyobacter sp. S3.2.2.5]
MAIEHPQQMTVQEYFQLEENDLTTCYEYLLLDGKSPRIEIYHKEQGKGIYGAFEKQQEIPLFSLGVYFPLLDAYLDVEVEPGV